MKEDNKIQGLSLKNKDVVRVLFNIVNLVKPSVI